MCFFWGDFTQRRLIVSCQRFGTTVGGGEILTAVLVKIQVIWDVSPCWLVNLPASSGSTAQDVTFFVPSSHPRFYRSRSLSLLWLHGILSQRKEKVCTIFICLFFWGGHFNAFGVLEHVMNAVTALRSTETSVTLHQSSTLVWERHVSQIRTPCRAKLLSDESFTDVKIIAAFTKAPQWTYFSFRALIY